MDELTKKANEVKSRFSISSYYHSQVKDPTPEMLKQINAEIDPETGNVVKKKRVKKEAKTTEKGKKTKGEESDVITEMELESDNEKEIELESDYDDDVIRDNKAAIAARKKEAEKKSESGEAKAAETKEVAEAKPKRAPRKRAAKDAEEKPKRATKDAEEKAKKEVEPKPDEKDIIPVDSDSDDDHYVPLSERLKRKMDGDKRSSIVDDLINTKSTVPVSRKRKSPAVKSDTAAKKRKTKDESSDDSLFGF